MQNSLWRQIQNRPKPFTSSVMRQRVSNFRLYCSSKKFQMLRKNVKSLLEQFQVCIFAEIVFGVRCTLRKIYNRENEFSKSSPFTRMLCGFLPECIAPSTRVHCATNNTRLWHCCNCLPFSRGLQLRQVSGYGLLWFTCKAMWAKSCLAFTTLAVVVNAEFESLETLPDD